MRADSTGGGGSARVTPPRRAGNRVGVGWESEPRVGGETVGSPFLGNTFGIGRPRDGWG